MHVPQMGKFALQFFKKILELKIFNTIELTAKRGNIFSSFCKQYQRQKGNKGKGKNKTGQKPRQEKQKIYYNKKKTRYMKTQN